MRNMSFAATIRQILEKTKTVTRRGGWEYLKPGERFAAVRKCQGLRPGEKIERLAVLECVSNRREPLGAITAEECAREGFPEMTPAEFCELFGRINPGCGKETEVSRIEFRYVEVETELF